MRHITVFATGKLKEPFYQAAVEEYAKRLSAYCKLSIVEYPEERLPKNPSPAEIAVALEHEGERMLAESEKAYRVAMCIEGKTWDSLEFARHWQELANRGTGDVALFIGSSYGLAETVKAACREKWSLSRMTWPHHLARIMLLEQLYRAFDWENGGKYHK